MDVEAGQTSGKTEKSHKKSLIKKLIIPAILLLVAGLAILATWYPLNAQNNNLNAKNEKLSGEAKTLREKLDASTSREKQLSTENAQQAQFIQELTNPEVRLPTLKIVSQQHYNGPPGALNIFFGNEDFMLIKIEVTNNTKTEQYFDVTAFKLKDGNITIPYYKVSSAGSEPRFVSGVTGDYYLPAGYTEIKSQSLEPGETLEGALIFHGPKSVTKAVLSYDDNNYDISF